MRQVPLRFLQNNFRFPIFRLALSATCLTAYFLPLAQGAGPVTIKRTVPSFDKYTNNPSRDQQQWMRTHYSFMKVFTPYFDRKTAWYANAVFYNDLYAIYPKSDLLKKHPEWLLKDQSGEPMYIPWGCSNGTCPQFAADITNDGYRDWWIGQAQRTMANGYAGIWVDDVNMQFQVSDHNGKNQPPMDPRTSRPMAWEDWRTYMAHFVEQIRQALPASKIIHNAIWYAAPKRTNDEAVRRQMQAADYFNLERGINDKGLTGGSGDFSLEALFRFVDVVHSFGKNVIFDDLSEVNETAKLEYALAGYYLVQNGRDMIADADTPDETWPGYQMDLGNPQGARSNWHGLMRRDYTNGMVLLNPPGSSTQTVQLPGSFRNWQSATVNTVTLGARQGAVLSR